MQSEQSKKLEKKLAAEEQLKADAKLGRSIRLSALSSHTTADQELQKKLLDILEPHYWNQGAADGKKAAKNSITYKNLMSLIKSDREAHVKQARLNEALMNVNMVQSLSHHSSDLAIYEIRRAAMNRVTTLQADTPIQEATFDPTQVSLCPHCNCMTHTVDGKCGKCKEAK